MYKLNGYHCYVHIQQSLWETNSLIYKVIGGHSLTELKVSKVRGQRMAIKGGI